MLFVQPYLYNEWEDYSKANWFLCTLKTSEYTIPLFPLGGFFFFFFQMLTAKRQMQITASCL